MCKAEALALFEKDWELYPVKKGKGQVSDAQKMKLLKIGYDEMASTFASHFTGSSYLSFVTIIYKLTFPIPCQLLFQLLRQKKM